MAHGWSEETEHLLSEWSEKASCFRWLHSRCEKKYRTRYYLFSVPVIILSTATGFLNVGLSEFVPDAKMPIAQASIGAVNLLAGVLMPPVNAAVHAPPPLVWPVPSFFAQQLQTQRR